MCRSDSGPKKDGQYSIIIVAKVLTLFWQVCGAVGVSGMARHGGGVWTPCQCGGPR